MGGEVVPLLQVLIPLGNEVAFEVSDQRWLQEVRKLYSGDRLAEGPRVRGILPLAGSTWIITGSSGGWEVRGEEIIPRATYTGRIWEMPKRYGEYTGPDDYYLGRLVRWRKEEWIIVERRLRLVNPTAPRPTWLTQHVPIRPVWRRRKRKRQPVAAQLSLLETLVERVDASLFVV